MRLWTLHPRYLDPRGSVALWREALLAQAVLRGETRGYRHHPQLVRFLEQQDPLGTVASYLEGVSTEAKSRGYRFDTSRISHPAVTGWIEETRGQMLFEWGHLQRKLAARAPATLVKWKNVSVPDPHPLFRVVAGDVRPWERGAM
ncbi:MAG: DNA lyase [Magnetococcales bacterium]|nr:DNA lyase [Magnetococcales bacterium]